MKTAFKSLLFGGAVAALPIAASALTTFGTSDSQNGGAGSSIDVQSAGGGTADITFTWDNQEYMAYQDFTSDREFDLFFTNYEPSGNWSGFVLIDLTNSTRLTTGYALCTGLAIIEELRGRCDRISDTKIQASHLVDGGTPMFAGLAAGTYRIGVYSANLTNGVSAFAIDPSPIPLPAGGLLLAAALGGAGMLRRRKADTV